MTSFEQDSDESLMERVMGGDHQAFAFLVRRHTQKFFGAAYRMCGDPDEAEDVVQEAFMKLWNRPEAYDRNRGAKFTTWFYRVVTNLAIDRKRRKKPGVNPDVLDVIADKAPRADEMMQISQEQAQLERAIQALPDRQRAALNLCFYEGVSNKEAAEILGIGLKAVESLLMRAKTSLREELARQGIVNEYEGRKKYAG
jgi:RNA polymerase sigma-70 factor (ECF subfamily)